ncbi:MAG: phosphate/phosphite/phosphonate ABC transporter substrate-binding protein [Gammaproteobacteria bacterium]|nr:phosphate/phosphite/phosphonate ABC transporter substrate-binding protein [Gammaproteobacteria bacterium]
MLISGSLLTACDSQSERKAVDLRERLSDEQLREMPLDKGDDGFVFGFDLRGSPEEDARQYLPFLKYLEEATGLHFILRFTPKSQAIGDELGTGKVQFAAIGAGTYIQAHLQYGVIPLVRGMNTAGRAEYQSVFVVAPHSPLRKIGELRGKHLAFGSVTSTQGHIIPRIVLNQHGLSLDDLAGHEYTGSHRNCANAMAAGRFDMCGMQDILGRRMADDGLVRIIHTSEFYPSSGIAVNRDVPPEVMEKVKRAMIDFKPTGAHAEGLYHWDRTEMANGFIEARDEDYAKLREWTIKFGLINGPVRETTP